MITLTIVFLFLDVIFILLLRKLYNEILDKLKENAQYTGYFLLEKRPALHKLLHVSIHMLKDINLKRIKTLVFMYTSFITLFSILTLTSFIIYLFI